MTLEKVPLVEQIARAIYLADAMATEGDDGVAWDTGRVDRAQYNAYVSMAEAALAVFEKARTPTDDEQLADQILRDAGIPVMPARVSGTRQLILTALRRRSEPSVRTLTPCGSLVCTGCRLCGCPALGIAPAAPEPQGEPSDAQVEAGAREAFFTDDAGGHIRGGHTWDTIPEAGRENYRTMVRAVLHAALRAAGGVR